MTTAKAIVLITEVALPYLTDGPDASLTISVVKGVGVAITISSEHHSASATVSLSELAIVSAVDLRSLVSVQLEHAFCAVFGRRDLPTTPVEERRAPVLGDTGDNKVGTIAWWEHEKAWCAYRDHGFRQDAEWLAAAGGFTFTELVDFLGHEPTTWRPRGDECSGVAGDRCEVGNECGRVGCPECQD